ncbi:MAG: hypothetical protein ABR556_14470, partial [Pyrinomonadaceae bacterium]
TPTPEPFRSFTSLKGCDKGVGRRCTKSIQQDAKRSGFAAAQCGEAAPHREWPPMLSRLRLDNTEA